MHMWSDSVYRRHGRQMNQRKSIPRLCAKCMFGSYIQGLVLVSGACQFVGTCHQHNDADALRMLRGPSTMSFCQHPIQRTTRGHVLDCDKGIWKEKGWEGIITRETQGWNDYCVLKAQQDKNYRRVKGMKRKSRKLRRLIEPANGGELTMVWPIGVVPYLGYSLFAKFLHGRHVPTDEKSEDIKKTLIAFHSFGLICD
ncbi:hypothetical protein TorRG33x02_161920 [Trema orientale]|uniref:Uncharacterized protein n=1 Tax=Trema orientale TaxID=63057 RepID=A0A2P5ER13_TREOI|nr:hypothetical protein TorRG33x02_161920 [Trema orientale]